MRRPGQGRSTRPARVFARAGVLVAAMLAVAAFGPAVARAAMPAAFMPQTALHGSSAYNEPICQSHSSLCRDALDNPGDEYVGHDEPSIDFRSSGRARERHHLPPPAPAGGKGEAEERRLRRHVELRAARDILARAHALRHRVGAGVHEDLHGRLGRECAREHEPGLAASTSASTRETRSWSCSSTARGTCRSSRASAARRTSTARR